MTVSEFQQPVETVLSAIAQRGAAKGRPEGSAGHGNSTKRVKLLIPGLSTSELMVTLKAESIESTSLPAATLRMVQQSMIDAAIAAYRAGTEHGFAESTKYDVLLPSGDRLPPKAVFGIALSEIIGRPATPHDFSAGWGTPCFSIIEAAGYPIVEKDEIIPISASEIDDERTWAEGTPRRVAHLRRERAPGLSRAKKRSFIEQHGELSCERCHITAKSLGEYGDACIEVHHARVAVAAMDGNTRTRLSDLICLCANCHRIVHRQEL
ncbi:MAG: hypothetical protein GC201_09715 [Alphaproteobacteria bacterium]|nr:hypothetical protein [Alphaproteobacteria bacterium]